MSLAVPWLRLGVSNAGGASLIPGLGTKIPQATRCSQKLKKKKKKYPLKTNLRHAVELGSMGLLGVGHD